MANKTEKDNKAIKESKSSQTEHNNGGLIGVMQIVKSHFSQENFLNKFFIFDSFFGSSLI
jgi:hypothetical protein